MILYVNGCSWTAGGGLEIPLGIDDRHKSENDEIMMKQHVWSQHLGTLLGAEKVINDGRGCGSNQRIIRTTFDFLSSTEINPEKLIVGIQLTESTRFEFYQETNISKHKWPQIKIDINETEFNSTQEIEFTNRFINYYRSSDEQNFYHLVFVLNTLSNIFFTFNISKYFFWTEKNWYNNDLINKNMAYFTEKFPFMILDDFNIDYLPCSHPSLIGHKQLAHKLKEWLDVNL